MAKGEEVIVIKRKKVSGHGHHGGAWKVAYADFVTAMMAFFLVMWLMGSDDEVKSAISHYFTAASVDKTGRDPASTTNNPTGDSAGQGDSIMNGAVGLMPADLIAAAVRSPSDALSEYKDLKAKVQSELDTIAYGMELNADLMKFSIGEDELFEHGEMKLKPDASTVLDKVGKLLRTYPGFTTVSGHIENTKGADTHGMSAFEFTNARAVSVMEYLVEHEFVAQDHISPRGFGSQDPVANNELVRGQRMNRRIEFTLRGTSDADK